MAATAVRKGLKVPARRQINTQTNNVRQTDKSTLEEHNCAETGFRDPHLC